MATRKPISNITYNSEAFLREKLDAWVNAHIIQAYQYICHKGEDGDKDHIHFRLEPNTLIDPMDLGEDLREFQIGKDKPLGPTLRWRPSKEEDWILYAVHDPEYLKLKYNGGEKGEKIPYSWQEIRASEYYDVEVSFIRAKSYLAHTSVNVTTRIQSGVNPVSLLLEGENPAMLGTILRVLQKTDYERVTTENSVLRTENALLREAIQEAGFSVFEDVTGKLHLSVPE